MWRDQGIDVATEIAQKNKDVALFSLDFKSYFYQLDVNFNEIVENLKTFHVETSGNLKLALNLTKILKKIFEVYNERIRRYSAETHAGTETYCSLPIGFASSSILGNWLLCDFDNNIADNVRPSYYGRYVDDVIMVFEKPKICLLYTSPSPRDRG